VSNKKQQTYIAALVDETGRMRDFYRFSCKKASTVEKRIRQAMSAENTGLNSIYRWSWMQEGVVACEISATPDGYHKEGKPVIRFAMDWVA